MERCGKRNAVRMPFARSLLAALLLLGFLGAVSAFAAEPAADVQGQTVTLVGNAADGSRVTVKIETADSEVLCFIDQQKCVGGEYRFETKLDYGDYQATVYCQDSGATDTLEIRVDEPTATPPSRPGGGGWPSQEVTVSSEPETSVASLPDKPENIQAKARPEPAESRAAWPAAAASQPESPSEKEPEPSASRESTSAPSAVSSEPEPAPSKEETVPTSTQPEKRGAGFSWLWAVLFAVALLGGATLIVIRHKKGGSSHDKTK